MHIDLAVFALVAVSAAFGYHSGAVRQLSHWIGLAAGLLLAKPAAALAGPWAASLMGWPAPPAAAVMRLAMFPVVFLVAGLLARLGLDLLEPGEERGPLDQTLGLAVGVVRGTVVSFALLCAAVYLEKPLARLGVDLSGSRCFALARGHNILAQESPSLSTVEKALEPSLQRAVPMAETALKAGLRSRPGR